MNKSYPGESQGHCNLQNFPHLKRLRGWGGGGGGGGECGGGGGGGGECGGGRRISICIQNRNVRINQVTSPSAEHTCIR